MSVELIVFLSLLGLGLVFGIIPKMFKRRRNSIRPLVNRPTRPAHPVPYTTTTTPPAHTEAAEPTAHDNHGGHGDHDHGHSAPSGERGATLTTIASMVLITTLIIFVIFNVGSCVQGCGGCYKEKVVFEEAFRGPTPVTIPEADLPKYGQIDALGAVWMNFPHPNGKGYFPCPYPGFGAKVDFQEVCGPRGHGDILITSQDRNKEVIVVLYRKSIVKVRC